MENPELKNKEEHKQGTDTPAANNPETLDQAAASQAALKVTLPMITEIRAKVKEKQNPHRYEHTLGVAYTAACMAFLFGEDPLRAELTGILHDCAKCFTDAELIRMCGEAGIPLSDAELASPAVIHAKYGSFMAEQEFGIRDREMLSAIKFHTTGRPDMSRLEKIIFIADFIEPLRDQAANLPEARKLAFDDLDECVYNILESTINYLNRKKASIVPETLRAYEWYRSLCRKDNNSVL